MQDLNPFINRQIYNEIVEALIWPALSAERLLPVWVMKEVSEQFCDSAHVDDVNQRVPRSAAEDAPSNVMKLIVTCMKGVPQLVICFNPHDCKPTR